tara:strand:- start:154668 stop:156479 length:1812 start_codon:yes stop_codon:yes gene_type:complete
MSRTTNLSILLSLLLASAACGGGNDNASADAADITPEADAAVIYDAGIPADADTTAADADLVLPDAQLEDPDAAIPVDNGVDEARASADGTVDLAIAEVFVTYLKPALGNDDAGFFVQAETTGPALFIAIDPATLTTPVAVGDLVSFTITEMATAGTLRMATAISGESIISSGNDLTALAQDVSAAADLVSALDDYESELVTAQLTVTEAFGGAGSGFSAGVVETAAVTANADLRLRLPETLQASLGLVPTCTITLAATPVWRFNTAVQLSAFDAAELTADCPPPLVVEAVVVSETEVTVEFDRAIDAASIVADGSQFAIDNDLVASAAVVDGRIVTLTTGTMLAGTDYTITIADTVLDVLGAAVAAPNNTALFSSLALDETVCDDGLDDDSDGFFDCQDAACAGTAPCTFLSQLYLWEVDADQAGTDAVEFVEIWNNTGAAIDLEAEDYYLLLINGSNGLTYSATALTGTIASDGLFVIGSDDAGLAADQVIGSTNIIQNGQDGVLLVQCATCTDSATDFPNGTDAGIAATFTTGGAQTATKIDGVAYDTNDADDANLISTVGGAAQFNEDANGESEIQSNNRTSLTGWNAQLANPGASGVE